MKNFLFYYQYLKNKNLKLYGPLYVDSKVSIKKVSMVNNLN